MVSSYAEILECLDARRSGRGWDGCCPLAARHRNGDRRPSLRLWVGERGELVARCLGCGANWGEIVRATGIAARHWWPPRPDEPQPRWRRPVGRVVATYDYRDGEGNLVAQKLRKEPGPNGAKKSFSWRRPLPADIRDRHGIAPTAAAWVWGLEEGLYAPFEGDELDWRPCAAGTSLDIRELPRVSPGLFRLPELLAEPFEHPVCVVEGERKALAMVALGLCAVSPPNGARQWNHDWAGPFRGRKVVVIPDNNVPGLALLTAVVGSLVLHGAAAVKAVEPGDRWPLKPDEDVLDWLGTVPPQSQRRELAALFGRFPAYAAALPKAA